MGRVVAPAVAVAEQHFVQLAHHTVHSICRAIDPRLEILMHQEGGDANDKAGHGG